MKDAQLRWLTMADSIGNLLFKDKQLRLLLALSNTSREWHISDLAKAADVTYVHTSRFISRCEESGIVATERHGRAKRVFLTEKGTDVASTLQGVVNKINQPKAQAAQKPALAGQPKPQ